MYAGRLTSDNTDKYLATYFNFSNMRKSCWNFYWQRQKRPLQELTVFKLVSKLQMVFVKQIWRISPNLICEQALPEANIVLAKASKPQILCSSKPALSPQGSVHYKVHTQNYVHKTGTRCTVKCVLQSKHTKLCAQNWRLLRNPQKPEENSILSQQHPRKSVQTKSFSANENISLLYNNSDQCSLT